MGRFFRVSLIAIAKWGGVNFEWLATGRGPKRPPSSNLRPKLQALLHAAESLPDYKVEELIRIVDAIAPKKDPEMGRSSVGSNLKARLQGSTMMKGLAK